MVCWVGWEQLRETVWYGAGTRKLGDGDRMVTSGGTEIKDSISSHPIPIPFRWEYHPNTLPRKALFFFKAVVNRKYPRILVFHHFR